MTWVTFVVLFGTAVALDAASAPVVRLSAGPRAVAALLVLAGLVLTMNAAAPAVRAREPKAGYQVLAADFHVHSFPGDGVLPPWDLAVEARRRGLDAIALTNHNAMLLVAPRAVAGADHAARRRRLADSRSRS